MNEKTKTNMVQAIVQCVQEGGDEADVHRIITDAENHRELHEDSMGVSPDVIDPISEGQLGFGSIEDYKWWLQQQGDEFWDLCLWE